MLQTVICKWHCCIWLFLSLALPLSLTHSISFGELFGSLLLACLVRMVTELFGVWFPRSICRFHELGPGSIEASVTCLAGGGGEVGTMRAGCRAMGAPQGNSGGPPPNPSSSTARGLQRWRWWGWRWKSNTERGEKNKKKRGQIAQWHLGD